MKGSFATRVSGSADLYNVSNISFHSNIISTILFLQKICEIVSNLIHN